jgi:AraC family transcriptional regulator
MSQAKSLVSMIGSNPSSGVEVERWRYTAAFRKGPSRSCHTIFLNPAGIRYEGRIADRRVLCDGTPHAIGIVPAGADCTLQLHASSVDVFALCIHPDQYSSFALNAGLATAHINEGLIDVDVTMHHLCNALLSANDEAGSSGTLLWEAISQAIFARLATRYARKRPASPGSLSPNALSRVLSYIRDNLDGNIRIDAIAAVAGLSPFHFSRAFARTIGHSPHRYIMLARVERAVALLRGSSLSLAEIASQAGFADQSHMARHVRQRHGIPPKALRLKCTP